MSRQALAEMEHIETTAAEKPPMERSDEANEKQHQLARNQGKALEMSLREMSEKVAQRGEEQAFGHFLVGYAFERPEGMYTPENGDLKWHEPEDENVHIEISVRDGADGRFVPALNVTLTVLDADGDEVGTHNQPFLWHPWLYHYGRNWELPGDGQYSFRVQIDMPDFPRHDKKNGKRYTGPVVAEFRDIPVKIYPAESK